MPELEKVNQTSIQNENQKPLESLPLVNGYYHWQGEGRNMGEPIEIFFKQLAFQNAWDSCYNNQFTPPQAQQTGGVLLGKVEQIGNGYKIYVEKTAMQIMEGEGNRTIPSTESWEPSEREKAKMSNSLKYRADYRELYEIGFFHGYVDDKDIRYFNQADNVRFWKQYNKPWQIGLILQAKHAKGIFFHWEKQIGGTGFTASEEFSVPEEYQYDKDQKARGKGFRPTQNNIYPSSEKGIQLQPSPNIPDKKVDLPNFAQFTPEHLKKKGYEAVIAEYKVEFGRLIDTDSHLEPFRSHITTYTDLAIKVARQIKDDFQQRNIPVTPERIKEIHSDFLKKGFDKAKNFPLKGEDAETKYAKEKLISALSVICDIEEMNTHYSKKDKI